MGDLLFDFFKRKIRYLCGSKRTEFEPAPQIHKENAAGVKENLDDNICGLKSLMSGSSDLIFHPIQFGSGKSLEGTLVYIDGLVSGATLTDAVLRPLMGWNSGCGPVPQGKELMDILSEQVLCSSEIRSVTLLADAVAGCLSGDTALLIGGCGSALLINTKGWEKRSINEPQSETVVRGPREGFTENIRTNTAMIRRKIRSGQLRTEHMTVGRKTQTDLCLMYLCDVADPKVVDEVKYRIGNLEVDSVLESGYIEEYIEDAPFSPFSTVNFSEKPDVVAGRVLEGRVAILVDGTPFVLTVPMLFIESFQTAEDYYLRSFYASMMRALRIIGYGITVFAPAVYIALTAFHQELIPTRLLFTIANSREGTPFPVFVETLIMVFAFEVLREAGIRLPRPVGQAISIVGALVMGDAAVSAGLVGAPVVITIAITAVASFLVPNQNDSASVLRLFMMALAAFVGWYGISIGFLAVMVHLATLSSFGVPYFEGLAWDSDLQDSVVRLPHWFMIRRPREIAKGNITRRRFFIPPLRPHAQKDKKDEETE